MRLSQNLVCQYLQLRREVDALYIESNGSHSRASREDALAKWRKKHFAIYKNIFSQDIEFNSFVQSIASLEEWVLTNDVNRRVESRAARVLLEELSIIFFYQSIEFRGSRQLQSPNVGLLADLLRTRQKLLKWVSSDDYPVCIGDLRKNIQESLNILVRELREKVPSKHPGFRCSAP